MTSPPELRIREIRERRKTHWLRRAEVPVEHYVSLLLPTLRWSAPGLACFASPTRRRHGEPTYISPPDRWWVLDARNGVLIIYARIDAARYADDLPTEPEMLSAPTGGVAELREQLETIEQLVESLAPHFYAGRTSHEAERRDLRALLDRQLPGRLGSWQRALTPDFYAWLET